MNIRFLRNINTSRQNKGLANSTGRQSKIRPHVNGNNRRIDHAQSTANRASHQFAINTHRSLDSGSHTLFVTDRGVTSLHTLTWNVMGERSEATQGTHRGLGTLLFRRVGSGFYTNGTLAHQYYTQAYRTPILFF